MSVAQMREFLANKYSASFSVRLESMSDAQVVAIYNRTINRRK